MRRILGVVAVVLLVAGGCVREPESNATVSGQAEEATRAPDDWQEYRPLPVFSFRAPQGLQRQPVQAVDSGAGVYAGGGIEVIYDLGRYADPLTPPVEREVSRRQLMVDGLAATLVESDSWAAIHFPRVHENVGLTLTVRWETPEARSEAVAVLRTVRFP
jgi:hypothetical protein